MAGDKKPGPETGKKPEEASGGAETEHHAENLEALAGEYEPADERKPGENRKPEDDDVSAEKMAKMLKTVFTMVSVRAGSHWQLDDEEAAELGRDTDAVITKHLGKSKLGPEMALLFTGVAVIGPRVALTVAMQNQKQAQPQPAANDDANKQEGKAANGD
jgi:hypothetical protein